MNASFALKTKVRPPSRLISEVSAKYKDVPTKILKRDVRTNSSKQNIKICVGTVQIN